MFSPFAAEKLQHRVLHGALEGFFYDEGAGLWILPQQFEAEFAP
jgi:hypothetical protein